MISNPSSLFWSTFWPIIAAKKINFQKDFQKIKADHVCFLYKAATITTFGKVPKMLKH